MKMFIYSKFGVLDCVPMTLQAIEKSIPTVTATDKEETKVASESCCEISQPVSDGTVDVDETKEI